VRPRLGARHVPERVGIGAGDVVQQPGSDRQDLHVVTPDASVPG
jgi:hypothetical protein